MKANDTRALPRTGQQLTLLGLGCAPLGNLFNAISDIEAQATVDAAWAAGLRYFDTAPYYGYTYSEHRLGQVLRQRQRSDYCLSTKVGRLLKPRSHGLDSTRPLVQGDAWVNPLPFEPHFDYTAGGVRRSIEDSLQRLGVAYIDLALVHDIGSATHGQLHAHYWQQLTVGGGLRALEDMRAEGLIGAIGLGVNEWQVVLDTLEYVDLDCTLLAGRYTLLEQGALRPLLEVALQRQVGIIIGGPFNSGILATGPVRDAKFNYETAPAEVLARVEQLQKVCSEFGVPLAAAALQFPLAHPAVVSCVPGVRSADELGGVVQWFETVVPPELWQTMQARGLLADGTPLPCTDP